MADVFCAFTGALPDDADMPVDHPLEDDDLADLPVGWTRITLQTRVPNPEWQTIQAVEEAMVRQVMEGVPKAQRRDARIGVKVQVAAQLAALRAQTAPYLIRTEILHVSPAEENAEAFGKLRTLLSLDAEATDAAEPEAAEADTATDAGEGSDG